MNCTTKMMLLGYGDTRTRQAKSCCIVFMAFEAFDTYHLIYGIANDTNLQ